MEENNFVAPVENPTPPIISVEKPVQKNGSGFLVFLLSTLLIISVLIAGFFAYQTQNLVKELTLLKSSPSPIPTPTSTSDETENWTKYGGDKYGYYFKAPANVKVSDQNDNVLNVSYMGEKQTSSGRTQSELFDGYSFTVSDISAEGSSIEDISKSRLASFGNSCEKGKISSFMETEIDGTKALKYDESCLGDYTIYLVSKDQKIYEISELYVGETSDQSNYKKITDLITSTFKFLDASNASSSLPVVCTADAKLCPDGSSVGRSGPKCEFSACPTALPL